MHSDDQSLFHEITQNWRKGIKCALDHKRDVFGKDAEECAKFFDGPANWMWNEAFTYDADRGFLNKSAGSMTPMFRMTVNKPFEAVAIFGPALLHRYPQVMVTPINPPHVPLEMLGFDPNNQMMQPIMQQMEQQDQMQTQTRATIADLKQEYLNWLQVETDKKTESRRSINEAIVVGAGYLYTHIHTPPGGQTMYPRSIHVSWRDIVKDPDAMYDRDVTWMAVRHREPINLVERKFGLKKGALKGTHQSYGSQSSIEGEREGKSGKHGNSYDIIEYWEIYSKNGIGNRLKLSVERDKVNASEEFYEQFGDFCYIVVSEGVNFPLNLPPTNKQANPNPDQMGDMMRRAAWPIPYYGDGKGWPISELGFYDKLNCVYPLGLFKPCLGELRFINWCMSFLADKVASSSITYLAAAKEVVKEIQEQVTGGALTPFQLLSISQATEIPLDRIVSFIQSPNFSVDIWNMVAQVMELIDKRTGLTELIYGLTGTQIRSATEASVRDQNLNVRPDDMAQKVEDWYSESARKEMMAACWLMQGQHVQPVLGERGARLWDGYVVNRDYEAVIREYNYRIEAGSGRKPNKQSRIQSLNEFGQFAMQPMAQMAAAGIVSPINAYWSEYAKAMDMDATPFLLPEPPPPPEQQGPSPEEIQMQMDQQRFEMEMQGKQMDLQIKQAEFGLKQQGLQAEQQGRMQQLELDLGQGLLDLEQDQQKHEQEMEQAEEKAKLDLQIQRAKAKASPKPQPKKGR